MIVAGKFVIAGGASANGQRISFATQITAQMALAGYKLLGQGSDHNASSIWNQTYRMSPWDQHNSKACIVSLVTSGVSGLIRFAPIFDANIQTLPGQVLGALVHWLGTWTASGFPTTSFPEQVNAGSAANGAVGVSFDGTSSWTVRFVISEFGIWIKLNNGTNERNLIVGRPLGNTQPGRNLFLQGIEASPPPFGSLGALSGSGSATLKFQADAREIAVTIPTGLGPSGGGYITGELAQEITMQSGGICRGQRRDIAITSPRAEALRITMEPERVPSAGIPGAASQLTPMLRMSYQDPSLVAMGVDFSLIPGGVSPTTMDPATTPLGEFTIAGETFLAKGVRRGCLVYNRTLDTTAEVVAFGSLGASTIDEATLYLDAIGVGWTTGHVYDILPYTDQQLGSTSIGGSFQCFLDSDVTAAIEKPGSDVDVILNDVYGEARNLYTAGQGVQIISNSLLVKLTVTNSTGYFVGQMVEDALTFARGIIRAISANDLMVDTVSGNTVDPTAAPWAVGVSNVLNNIVGVENPRVGGASGSDVTAIEHVGDYPVIGSAGPQGWAAYVIVTVVAQKSATDFRTVLTLDLDDGGINTDLNLMPGSCIGIRAKTQLREEATLPATFMGTASIWPSYTTGAAGGTDYTNMDIRRNEVDLYGTPEPPHAPDYETGSVDVSPLYIRHDNVLQGYASIGSYAHMKGVSAFGSQIQQGDELHEDGDTERRWYTGALDSNETKGASTSSPNVSQRILLGPGGPDLV